MQRSVRVKCVNSFAASSPFFLAAGSDVKNKDPSVYAILFYEYLLLSLALHY